MCHYTLSLGYDPDSVYSHIKNICPSYVLTLELAITFENVLITKETHIVIPIFICPESYFLGLYMQNEHKDTEKHAKVGMKK